ncbi:MAG: hypothetical protein H7Z16_17030 [Pyrinomonadaceae bacterium]|nr:hypothetical protein [Pyrinomonadaceae bacterium]
MATIDFSIAIQHTPAYADRRRWVESMVKKLRAEEPTLRLEVIKDKEREGSWPTYLRTLQAASGASHHLMLNDDLSLCKDFVASVREVIQARPNALISLYTNSPVVFTARRRRESWIQNTGVEGAAVIWPTTLIAEFIEWQSVHIAPDFPFEDVRVSMWLYKTSKPAFATVPSLIQHLGWGASLVGLNARSKVASWYVGDNKSALGIDWLQGRRSPARHTMLIRPEWWQHFQA